MASMWKPDPVQIRERKMDAHIALHREAGKRGWGTTPRLSSIDKRYYAEIDKIVTDQGRYVHTIPNLKLGTGDTPLEAAADGYVKAMPDDLVIRELAILARIEALLPVIERRAATLKKLDATLTDLTAAVIMVKAGVTDVEELRSKTVTTVIRDEDDDL